MTANTKSPAIPSEAPAPVAAAAKKVVQPAAVAAPAPSAPAPVARKAAPAAAETAATAKSRKPVKKAPATTAKPAAKPAAKAGKTAAKPAQKQPKQAVVKEPKAKKPKLVRDSFTIPKDEYAVIDTIKLRSAKLDHQVKKSELLRAGLKLLASLSDQQLMTALRAVPAIKTGRPKAEDHGKSSRK
ncbi:hypothetical protein [Diaphorobacter aerolatus]|uniref:Uncharacterized protein n=1 Tax=Diaphorobacter aerolatus TaxID=1288495 RepID=A0A7H0GLP7_9BURK|nr:hypothetical protein [Diaphorobacter aerolatus]QNP49213.1 hypothetical protein H9K75_03660 [Diaphorobacter aerolatus]